MGRRMQYGLASTCSVIHLVTLAFNALSSERCCDLDDLNESLELTDDTDVIDVELTAGGNFTSVIEVLLALAEGDAEMAPPNLNAGGSTSATLAPLTKLNSGLASLMLLFFSSFPLSVNAESVFEALPNEN